MTDESCVFVVPARGGSKRIPRKNILSLSGKPLITYTLEAAKGTGLQFPILVSTEDAEIARVSQETLGIKIVMRPSALATDKASTEGVLLHVLDFLGEMGECPHWVITLPPTSPFRSSNTIRRFVEEIRRAPEAQDCLMSVTENRGDFWQRQPDGTFTRLFKDAPRRQQERESLYEENSAIYVTRVEALRETGSILGRKVRALELDQIEGFDINNSFDVRVAEALLQIGREE